MNWHSKELNDVVTFLDTDIKHGLTSENVLQRTEKYGLNKLNEKPPSTFFQRFLSQMKDVMIIVMFIATAVSLSVNIYHALSGQHADWIEPIIIVLIVMLNGILGAVQEGKAEAALEALKKMTAPQARILRNGTVEQVSTSELVPGDIILLEAGDWIPADCRLIDSASLKTDEAALTGESVPADKVADTLIKEDEPLGDRINMLYSGCAVSYGRGTAVVVATGMDTEMGKIASILEGEETVATPLQQKLNQLGKFLGYLVLVICAVIFVIGIINKLSLIEIFMTAVSLAVSAIPEGLAAVVTIVLAIGVQRMVTKNAIIRRLPALETLGSTSVICSDKTGTLTQNRMTLVQGYADGEIVNLSETVPEKIENLIKLSTLCTDGIVEMVDGIEKHIGDPTETAIVAAALRLGIDKKDITKEFPRLGEIPFDSERKLMTTIHNIDNKNVVIVKGAPDILFERCSTGDIAEAVRINETMGRNALRVLAVGYKEIDKVPADLKPEELEKDLTLLGLVGMIDPPRPEVLVSVRECSQAGIKTVMITGDHVITASAIARELEILTSEEQAVTGAQLATMSEEDLQSNIRKYRVYARVTPADKIRIVKAWQQAGEIVAMTGDGVNDAPALKAADIGCAMGITGSDVAKGAAEMTLTDDNFATIVTAVKEGRGIYDNIRKTVNFLLSCNFSEVLIILVSMILWKESPLLPIHLLWNNLVTDGFPALALGVEPVEFDVMKRKPRSREESIFAESMGRNAILQGVMLSIITLTAYYIGTRSGIKDAGLPLGETMAFAVMAISQLVHAFNIRSSHSMFKVGLLSNKYMGYAFMASLSLMLVVLLVPGLQNVFKVVPMHATAWGIVIALCITPLVICELAKAMRKVFS